MRCGGGGQEYKELGGKVSRFAHMKCLFKVYLAMCVSLSCRVLHICVGVFVFAHVSVFVNVFV